MKGFFTKVTALFLVLLLCLFAGTCCLVWAEIPPDTDVQMEGYDYTIEDGEVSISTYFGEEKNLVIPDTIEGYPVTYIGPGFAINGTPESITLPDSLTEIAEDAFCYCKQLQNIVVGESNPNYSTVDGVLFNQNGTELLRCPMGKAGSYTVPDGVESIAAGAFLQCRKLTDITLPESVTEIGDRVFSECAGATQIALPKSLTVLGDAVFAGCDNLTEIAIPQGVTEIGEIMFYACDNLENIVLPDGIINIGEWAFAECDKLQRIVMPEALESIGKQAFRNCGSLQQVSFSKHVNAIGDWIFEGCTSLESVIVDADNQTYYTQDGVLLDKAQTQLLLYPRQKKNTTYKVPDSVTVIEPGAFSGCSALQSVELPAGLTAIRTDTFRNCTGLESITIPDSVTDISVSAFEGCSSLKRVVLQEGLKSIDSHAFSGCVALEKIVIPDSITVIGWESFSACDALQAIEVGENNTQYCSIDGVLFSKDVTQLLQYPGGKSGDYVVPDGVTTIKETAFHDCRNLTGITLSDRVESIENDGFYHCTALERFTVTDGNQHYSSVDGVLLNKDQSKLIHFPPARAGSYDVPNSVTTIAFGAFCGCALQKITLPESVELIVSSAFIECDSLQQVVYAGDAAGWNKIEIENNNTSLMQAQRQYGLQPSQDDADGSADAQIAVRPAKKKDPNRNWKIGGIAFLAVYAAVVVLFLILRMRANKQYEK